MSVCVELLVMSLALAGMELVYQVSLSFQECCACERGREGGREGGIEGEREGGWVGWM